MKVGLYANLSKPDAAATLKALATSARDLGVTLITSSKATARLAANCRTVAPARLGKSVDILLSSAATAPSCKPYTPSTAPKSPSWASTSATSV